MTAPAAIRLDETDNVATAVRPLEIGETVLGVVVAERIARGHKIALGAISAGDPVTKYGQFIGTRFNRHCSRHTRTYAQCGIREHVANL